MPKSNTIYTEESELVARFRNQPEYVNYAVSVSIKDRGKTPVIIALSVVPPYPHVAPIPGESYTVRAASITEGLSRVVGWLRRYGYRIK